MLVDVALQRLSTGLFCCWAAFGLLHCSTNTGTTSSVSSVVQQTYLLGGSVSGLAGQLTLQNANETLLLSTDGNFVFQQALTLGDTYNVQLVAYPSVQQCQLSNARGTVGESNITDVLVTCSSELFTIGVHVAGLAENGNLRLRNSNNNDTLSIANNGNAYFTQLVPFMSAYNITVLSQPLGQSCTLSYNSGVVGNGNVLFVQVACANSQGVAASTMFANPNSLVADGATSTTLTSSWRNAAGEPAAGVQITFSSSNANSIISPRTTYTDANGTARTTVASNVGNVTSTVYAQINGEYLNQTNVRFTCQAPFLASKKFINLIYQANPLLLANLVPSMAGVDLVFGAFNMLGVQLGYGNGFMATLPIITRNLSNNFLSALASADFNEDGNLDVAGSNTGAGAVTIFLGAGNGQFMTPLVAYSTGGSSTTSVMASNFFGTAHVDLATLSNIDNLLSLLQGRGDGTFLAPVLYTLAAGGLPQALASADFNLDSNNDLVIADAGNAVLSVLLSQGAGNYNTTASYSVPSLSGVLTADLNNDGLADLVAKSANLGFYVLLNLGNAGFATPVGYSFATGGINLACSDLNNDGNLDISSGNGNGGSSFQVDLGNGDGSFQPPVSYSANLVSTTSIGNGDLNGDGLNDVLISGDGQAAIFLQTPSGTLAPANFNAVALPGQYVLQVLSSDVNHDGLVDLVLTAPLGDALSVLLGNGDGSFQYPYVVGDANGAPQRSYTLAADVNADGKIDLLSNGGSAITVFLGTGGGSFAGGVSYALNGSGFSNQLVAGNFSGSGKVDVFVSAPSDGNLYLFAGVGDGTFANPVAFQVWSPGGVNTVPLAAGDFNGDGNTDVASANENANNIGVLLSLGLGQFAAPTYYATGGTPTALASGLLRGSSNNGMADLVVANHGASTAVLLNNLSGNGRLTLDNVYYSAPSRLVMLCDYNNDGYADIIGLESAGSGLAVILESRGDGTFNEAQTYNAGLSSNAFTYGDYNGDGAQDLVFLSEQGHNLAVALNNSSCW